MLTNSDFKELLKIFKKHKIRYLVVGGYAVIKYSEPRFTKDLDVFIETDKDNANGVYSALKEFGASLENLTAVDFAHEVYRLFGLSFRANKLACRQDYLFLVNSLLL